MTVEKPILIGMNNPVSTLPGHELYPLPEGCTGNRLWRMLNERQPSVRMTDYRDTFERRNLVVGNWNREHAKISADLMYAKLWGSRRTVVLLGEDVRKVFGHPRLLVEPQEIGGCTWRQIPHPSGRNFWYNNAENRKTVGVLLEELYANYHRGDTAAGGNTAGVSHGAGDVAPLGRRRGSGAKRSGGADQQT